MADGPGAISPRAVVGTNGTNASGGPSSYLVRSPGHASLRLSGFLRSPHSQKSKDLMLGKGKDWPWPLCPGVCRDYEKGGIPNRVLSGHPSFGA